MARKSFKNTVVLGLVLLGVLLALSWYHKSIMEGFQDGSAMKKAFEKFTDEQKAVMCKTIEDQVKEFEGELAAIKSDPTKTERVGELTTSIQMINDSKKTYNC